MGKRAAALLASPVLLGLCGALTACVPPAPLSVSGTLPPPSSTFTLIGDDSVAQAARVPLTAALAARGLRSVSENSDRLVMVTLADRPRTNGAAAGKALPDTPDAAQWVDRPTRGGLFAKGRREVRLTVIFFLGGRTAA